MKRCWPWSHEWGKYATHEYFIYPNNNPLRSYSGPPENLNEKIAISKQERTCARCGLLQVRSL